mmetsp:Transcript_118362/g.241919  ORF Transcript_118362/g.241919 Transcript_118362/m.241919 type:complete len:202 (+) Transcript_118362:247-852(+)
MFSKRAEPPPGETLPLPLETAARLVHRCCQAGSRNSPGRGPSVCWLRASESRSPGRDPTGSGRKRPHPAGSPRSPPVPCRCTLWSRLASERGWVASQRRPPRSPGGPSRPRSGIPSCGRQAGTRRVLLLLCLYVYWCYRRYRSRSRALCGCCSRNSFSRASRRGTTGRTPGPRCPWRRPHRPSIRFLEIDRCPATWENRGG